MNRLLLICFLPLVACNGPEPEAIVPEYFLSADQTHNKFSASIPPVLTVPDGAIIEVRTKEASDGQFSLESTAEDVLSLDFEPIHPLTGPVYIEGAEVGDVLAVTLHDIEIGDFGWTAITPGFGFLADEFTEPYLHTYSFDEGANLRYGSRRSSHQVRAISRCDGCCSGHGFAAFDDSSA